MAHFSEYIQKSNNLLKNINKYAIIVILLGSLGLIISPYLFTLPGKIDFSKTGDIGSTIGGITAPIVGIISVLLIYISFYAQFIANQIQFKALLDEKEEREKEYTIAFVERQLEQTRNEWTKFQNSITKPLTSYITVKGLVRNIIDSPHHLNIINNLLLKIDRLTDTLLKNETLREELKKRYIISDILLLLNDETKELFNKIRESLEEYYQDKPDKAFTIEMINRVNTIQMKINNVINKPENQDEVIELLKAMDQYAK